MILFWFPRVISSGRPHWKSEHKFKWRNHFELAEAAEVLFHRNWLTFRGRTMLCMSGIDPFFRVSFLFPKYFSAFCLLLFFFSKLCSAIFLVISRKNTVTVKTSEHWSVDMNSILNASNNGWCKKTCAPFAKQSWINERTPIFQGYYFIESTWRIVSSLRGCTTIYNCKRFACISYLFELYLSWSHCGDWRVKDSHVLSILISLWRLES